MGYMVDEKGQLLSIKEESSIVISVDRTSYPYFDPKSYNISYKEFINGIPTENEITCEFDKNGNITSFRFINRSFNWNDDTFNDRNIQENLDKFVKKYVQTTYDDWYLEKEKITKINNRTTMTVNLILVVSSASGYVYNLEHILYLS